MNMSSKNIEKHSEPVLDEILIFIVQLFLGFGLLVINIYITHTLGIYDGVKVPVFQAFFSFFTAAAITSLEILGVRVALRKLRVRFVIEKGDK